MLGAAIPDDALAHCVAGYLRAWRFLYVAPPGEAAGVGAVNRRRGRRVEPEPYWTYRPRAVVAIGGL